MSLTVAQIINIAKISQYLALNDIANGGLWGKGQDLELPQKIYNIRKSIEYWYYLDPSDTTLTPTSNYLLSLCGKYYLEAQNIIFNSNSVSTVSSIGNPQPYQFIVNSSDSFILSGESTKTITAFVNYNLFFVRNNITQSTVDNGGTYFSWTPSTGTFICYPAAAEGELFQLYAV